MFEFDASKIIILGIVALIAIPPKDLPGAMRQLGQMIGKIRRMAAEFQGQFSQALREADVESIKQDIGKVADSTRLDLSYNPISHAQDELNTAMNTPAQPLPSTPEPQIALPALPDPVDVSAKSIMAAMDVPGEEASAEPKPKRSRKKPPTESLQADTLPSEEVTPILADSAPKTRKPRKSASVPVSDA